jgi:hypothetical protein
MVWFSLQEICLNLSGKKEEKTLTVEKFFMSVLQRALRPTNMCAQRTKQRVYAVPL